MNPIEEQREIIDSLYELVYQSAPDAFFKAGCRFRYLKECDGSAAVDEQFWYFTNDSKKVSALLIDDASKDPMTLVPMLHAKTKTHTGGDWNAFTLTIEEDGRVTVKFEYPD